MIQQNDTIVLQENGEVELEQAHPRTWQPTVREVLSWLPAGATPEQQDSAVQAHIKPSDIAWSTQPDTLHLPGWPVGRSFRDVSLPKYYRESYFTGRPFFHPDLFGGRLGVAGDPVPYTIPRDNIITALLMLCFIVGVLAFTKSKQFMARQAKSFFRQPRGVLSEITETAQEIRFQLTLALQSCLLMGLVYFFYVESRVAQTFTVDQYRVIGLFALEFLGYIVAKALLYQLSGWVFFDPRRSRIWMKSWLFLLVLEGLALYPPVLLQAFFGTGVATTLACAGVVILLAKIMAFYKTRAIFFNYRGGIVQNFLYFCTLELIPIAALWGVLTITSNYLKVSF